MSEQVAGRKADIAGKQECHYCGPTDRDLRPYGPGGSTVCFPCATATPEREQAAKNAFGALLDGAEAVSPVGAVMIGTAEGPRPVNPPGAACACGSPETYSLKPSEVIVHAPDGCTVERAATPPAQTGSAQ